MSEEHDEFTLGAGLGITAFGVLLFAFILYWLIREDVSGFDRFLAWLLAAISFVVILVGLTITNINWTVRRTTRTTYGDTRLSGRIDLKRIVNESRTEGQPTLHKILVSGKEFDVDEVFYKYLRQGDEVEVHYWSETEIVVRVNKLVRPQ